MDSAKTASLDSILMGTSRCRGIWISIYKKAAENTIPTISRIYVYGTWQPTTPAWFQAKLNRINPVMRVIVPAKSNVGVDAAMAGSYSSGGGIRKLVAVYAKTIPITHYPTNYHVIVLNISGAPELKDMF
jgi:hypothetical protein